MLKKIKQNKKNILIASVVLILVIISFYLIYKLSNAFLLVIIGVLLLIIGSFIKDPESIEENEEIDNATQLSIFSEEVLEPIILEDTIEEKVVHEDEIIIIDNKKTKKRKNSEILDIENTNSYKFDNVSMKKTKKA